MRVVALLSGGKDSVYNTLICKREGHEIVCVLNLRTPGEKDSYMYQYAGNSLVRDIAECMGVPYEQRTTSGVSLNRDLEYRATEEDEVEDLFAALGELKKKYALEGVSVGAIKSSYQNNRVNDVCRRLGLVPLAYLWNRNQKELLREMIGSGMRSVMVKSGERPLTELVGRDLCEIYSVYEEHVEKEIEKSRGALKEEDFNMCGEGGEYETITLDCPIFMKRIVLTDSEVVRDGTGVCTLKINQYRIEDKLKVC